MGAISMLIDVKGQFSGLKGFKEGIKKAKQQTQRLGSQVNRTTSRIKKNFMQTEKRSQAFGNKLGFIAFQWTFIAGAAQRAFNTMVRGLENIIRKGAETQDAIVRAMVFSGNAMDLVSGKTEQFAKSLALIEKFGRGQTPFSQLEVATFVEQLNKALGDFEKTEALLPFAIKFKIAEPDINPEKLAVRLVNIVESANIDIQDTKELAAAFDAVANVANKSTLSFESAVASFALAAPIAKQAALTFSQTGALLAIGADNLALVERQKIGRNIIAFANDLQKAKQPASNFAKILKATGVELFEKGKFVGLSRTIEEVKGAFKDQGLAFEDLSDEQRIAFIKNLAFTARASRVLAVLIDKGSANIEKKIEEIKERGNLDAITQAIDANSAQNALKKIKNSIDALKTDIVIGLNPALQKLAKLFSEFVNQKTVLLFFRQFGNVLGEEILPWVTSVFKMLGKLFQILNASKRAVEPLVKTFNALVVIMGGMFITATVVSLLAIMGSIVEKLTVGVTVFGISLIRVFKGLLAFGVALFGIRLIMTELNKGLDEANPLIIALGAAMTGLSTAFILAGTDISRTFNLLKRFGGAIARLATSVPAAMVRIQEEFMGVERAGRRTFKDVLKQSVGSFKTGVKGLPGTMKGAFKALGPAAKAGVVAGGLLLIGSLIAIELDKRINNSELFNGGFQTKTEAAMFQIKAAIATSLPKIANFFVEFAKAVARVFESLSGFIVDILGAIVAAALKFFENPLAGAGPAFDTFKKKVSEAFDDFEIGQQLAETFNKEALARGEIGRTIEKFNKGQKDFGSLIKSIDEIIKTTETEDIFDKDELRKQLESTNLGKITTDTVLKQVFGSPFTLGMTKAQIKEFFGKGGLLDDPQFDAFKRAQTAPTLTSDQLDPLSGAKLQSLRDNMEGLTGGFSNESEELIAARAEALKNSNDIDNKLADKNKEIVKLTTSKKELSQKENEQLETLNKERVELEKEVTVNKERLNDLSQKETKLSVSTVANNMIIDKLSVTETVLFETLKNFINSIVIAQDTIDKSSIAFSAMNIPLARMKGAIEGFNSVLDTFKVWVDSSGNFHSSFTRAGTSSSLNRGGVVAARSNLESVSSAVRGNRSSIGISGFKEGQTVDQIIDSALKKIKTQTNVNTEVNVNIEGGSNLTPEELVDIINQAVVDQLRDSVVEQ